MTRAAKSPNICATHTTKARKLSGTASAINILTTLKTISSVNSICPTKKFPHATTNQQSRVRKLKLNGGWKNFGVNKIKKRSAINRLLIFFYLTLRDCRRSERRLNSLPTSCNDKAKIAPKKKLHQLLTTLSPRITHNEKIIIYAKPKIKYLFTTSSPFARHYKQKFFQPQRKRRPINFRTP